ncbi:MAG: hypothetical protein U5Q44_06050 [Dehalococcoidia bacterium]|nr:hypothetical protein [Dehalococcoidia bacterium]
MIWGEEDGARTRADGRADAGRDPRRQAHGDSRGGARRAALEQPEAFNAAVRRFYARSLIPARGEGAEELVDRRAIGGFGAGVDVADDAARVDDDIATELEGVTRGPPRDAPPEHGAQVERHGPGCEPCGTGRCPREAECLVELAFSVDGKRPIEGHILQEHARAFLVFEGNEHDAGIDVGKGLVGAPQLQRMLAAGQSLEVPQENEQQRVPTVLGRIEVPAAGERKGHGGNRLADLHRGHRCFAPVALRAGIASPGCSGWQRGHQAV